MGSSGCSVQSGGDWAAHWNTDNNGSLSGDPGYTRVDNRFTEYRGFYDINNTGKCDHYCKWGGNSGGGNPNPYHTTKRGQNSWSCKGKDNKYLKFAGKQFNGIFCSGHKYDPRKNKSSWRGQEDGRAFEVRGAGDSSEFVYAFDGCPRDPTGHKYGFHSSKHALSPTVSENRVRCEEICRKDKDCQAIEVNDCNSEYGDSPTDCKGNCWIYQGNKTEIYNDQGCSKNKNQKTYIKKPKGKDLYKFFIETSNFSGAEANGPVELKLEGERGNKTHVIPAGMLNGKQKPYEVVIIENLGKINNLGMRCKNNEEAYLSKLIMISTVKNGNIILDLPDNAKELNIKNVLKYFIKSGKSQVCELGCNRCGYNWYKTHWNNGNPTKWWNVYCGCCGGTKEQQNVCKEVCGKPKETNITGNTLVANDLIHYSNSGNRNLKTKINKENEEILSILIRVSNRGGSQSNNPFKLFIKGERGELDLIIPAGALNTTGKVFKAGVVSRIGKILKVGAVNIGTDGAWWSKFVIKSSLKNSDVIINLPNNSTELPIDETAPYLSKDTELKNRGLSHIFNNTCDRHFIINPQKTKAVNCVIDGYYRVGDRCIDQDDDADDRGNKTPSYSHRSKVIMRTHLKDG